MKRKFRILEIANDDGDIHYIVQQNTLWFFWMKSSYDALIFPYYTYDGAEYEYQKFYSLEKVKEALEQVKEEMKKKSKAHKKVIDIITIKV